MVSLQYIRTCILYNMLQLHLVLVMEYSIDYITVRLKNIFLQLESTSVYVKHVFIYSFADSFIICQNYTGLAHTRVNLH